MSASLIAFVGVIYLGIAVDEGIKGHWPMALVFVGYALANVGLYITAKG